MRSIINRNDNLGIRNALTSAKLIVRRGSDRPSIAYLSCALMAMASRLGNGLGDAFRHRPTATRWISTRVTGGASVVTTVGSGQHATCCLAAR